jgi:hypothetical protein
LIPTGNINSNQIAFLEFHPIFLKQFLSG